jgi:hypothetical protein
MLGHRNPTAALQRCRGTVPKAAAGPNMPCSQLAVFWCVEGAAHELTLPHAATHLPDPAPACSIMELGAPAGLAVGRALVPGTTGAGFAVPYSTRTAMVAPCRGCRCYCRSSSSDARASMRRFSALVLSRAHAHAHVPLQGSCRARRCMPVHNIHSARFKFAYIL